MSKRYAVVVGFDYHARYLARVLNAHAPHWNVEAFAGTRFGTARALLALAKADLLISFGGPGPSVALAEAAGLREIPVLVVWAGSDVQIASEHPFDLAVTMRRGYDNVAVAPWLVDELRTIGIEATTLAVGAVDAVDTIAPLPKRFRVLTYLPEPRRRFYGEDRVYAIARRMPGVEFVVLGPGGRNSAAPPNVTFAGHVEDVPRRIDDAAVLLRLTEHDGASVLVLEALARGRHVVWTHAYPGVHAARDENEAFEALDALYRRFARGALEPNVEGLDFVRRHFAPEDVAGRFVAHMDALLESPATQSNHRPHRVVISGLGLFSAEMAKRVESLHPEWKASVLSTNSRLEVCAALVALSRAELWYSIGSPITDRWVHLWAKILKKPRVVHWVGSDIEYLRNTPRLRRQLRTGAVKHLAEVAWTAQELCELGVSPEIAPLPLRHFSGSVKPLPERFTIMIYLPKSRPEFYGKRQFELALEELARHRPRVIVVGGGTLEPLPSVDVVNVGWRDDLRPIFEEVTLLVRLTPRDGLSLMVLEALSFGRYVMWSKPFPFSIHVRSRGDVTDGIRDLIARHERHDLFPQYAASEMVERQYSTERSVDRILHAWESVR